MVVNQVVAMQVMKNASGQSQSQAQMPETIKLGTIKPGTIRMRSFAPPAVRVLRSVGSRWQTGWQSARALADHPLMVIH